MSERTAFALWCDDIRQEIGNKPSFMGVYVGGVVVPSLPTILPRISVWLSVQSPLSKPIKEWSVKLVRDDGAVLLHMPTTSIPTDEAPSIPGRTMQNLMLGLTAAPLEIPIDCKYFSLQVEADGSPLDTQKLWIQVAGEDGAKAAATTDTPTAPKKRPARKKKA
jgi:hypothetical protein